MDAKINKAEKEIYALENTLQVLRGCNNNYKQSFKKVTPSSMWELLKILNEYIQLKLQLFILKKGTWGDKENKTVPCLRESEKLITFPL